MDVKSEQKRLKEQFMRDKLSQHFEEELGVLAQGIHKKGATAAAAKKIEKVWERIGRIKQKHHKMKEFVIL